MLKLKLKSTQEPSQDIELNVVVAGLSQQEYCMGRLPESSLILPSTEVSRLHAKIKFIDETYVITDAGSLGGTRLNQQALTPEQAYPLKVNDQISIGPYTLEVISVDSQGEGLELIDSPTTLNLGPPTELPVQAIPLQLLDLQALRPWPEDDLKVCCVRIIQETPDVKTFCFVAEPPVLFNYKPGQFVTLDLDVNGQSVSRSYSISSPPSRPHTLEISVKRVPTPEDCPTAPPGKVSNWLHDHLQVGNWITISGPSGKFSCASYPADKLLFISAGSGITPMMSMTRWLHDTVASADVIFFHNARTPEDIIYRAELDLLVQRMPYLQVAISLSRRQAHQPWSGLTGRLNAQMLELVAPDFRERTVFVCGPNPFMASVKSLLEGLGYPMTQYHEESFGKPKGTKAVAAPAINSPLNIPEPPIVTPIAPPPPIAVDVSPRPGYGLAGLLDNLQPLTLNQPHEEPVNSPPPASPVNPGPVASSNMVVKFNKTGKEVAADGELSILELAEQEGVKIRSSCRSGTCGTCKKRKLEGEILMQDYDPEALESDEQAEGFILTCISYPRGLVVIDA